MFGKVGASEYAHRDTRHAYAGSKPARVGTGESFQVAATVRDVSASGVALNVSAPFENGQFVEVRIEGLGVVAGNVTRVYDGGVAVQFQDRQDEGVERLNSLV